MRNKLILLATIAYTFLAISCDKKSDEILAMLQEIKQQNTYLKEQVTNLQKTTDSLSAALKLVNQNISSMDKKIDSIRNQLSSMITQINSLSVQLTQANVNIADLQKRISELQVKCQEMLDLLRLLTGTMNLSKGLVAFYPFTGNAGDSSGNQYHAIVKGAILTENRFGIADKAYDFDGINSRIEIPVFSTVAINKEFTFSMWVFNKPTNDAQSFFLRQGPNGVSKTWILKYSNQTSIRVYNENSYYGSFNSPNLKENEWCHLTVTIKDSIVCVFVNGVNIGCSDIGFPFNYSQNLNILGHSGGTGNQNYPFSGKMDEVRFYNRVLTQDEISYLSKQ